MAKVSFSKLEAKICNNLCSPFYCNTKGEEIHYEVKQYLPIGEKMEMISRIINQSVDENNFYNPMRVQVFTVLEITYAYTNLNFTAKQKEDPLKLYDQLISTGIFQDIKSCILPSDLEEIEKTIITTVDNIYKYKNSVMGILDIIGSDHEALNFDAQNLQALIGDPNNLALLRDIISKLG